MSEADAASPVAVYDFRHPVRLCQQKRAQLAAIHERVTRPLGDALGERLQMGCQVRHAGTAEVQSDQLFATPFDPVFMLTLPGEDDQILLRIATPLAQACIDRLLGGLGQGRTIDREPTDIEVGLLRLVAARLQQVVQRELHTGLAASEAHFLGAAARHAIQTVPGVAAEFMVQVAEAEGALQLFYSFDAVVERLLAGGAAVGEAPQAAAGPAKLEWKDIHPVRVPLRALLHPTSIQLRDLASLQVGDVVHLDQPIEREIDILVGERVAFRGHAGRIDDALGVQITRPV